MNLKQSFSILALTAELLFAMTLAGAERPRIGLALAGGSARGLAHIGVLQWMEEHHIPADNVAGTSMGGLIGGMYASGFDSQQMRDFIHSVPWDKMFLSGPEYASLSYRRREDHNDYPTVFEFGLKNGLHLPQAISSGHQVGLVISNFAAPYGEMQSFNDLPTPFRCVAVDLVEGKQVVFSEGSLGVALRSTMSLPAIFSPVRDGKRILVDGGVLNNLPVDVIKQMGSKIIIAVALGYPDMKPGSLENLLGIASRSLDTMIAANQQYALENADIIIAPNLAGLLSSDFLKSEEFIRRGYEAAEHKGRFLETLAVSDEEWKQYLEERRRKTMPREITPQAVTIAGVAPADQTEIRAALRPLNNHPLNPSQTETILNHVAGMGPYESANYSFSQTDDHQPALLVNIQKKLHGPPFLNLLLGLEGNDISNPRFIAGARLTFMNVGNPGSEWRSDLQVGAVTRFATEFYRKLGGSPWFVSPQASYEQNHEPVYEGNLNVAEYKKREGIMGVDLGSQLGRGGEIRFGYQAQHINAHVTTGRTLYDPLKGYQQVLRVRWIYDRIDSPVLPRSGIRHQLEIRYIPDSLPGFHQYGTCQERVLMAGHRGPYTVIASAAGGTTLGPEPPIPIYEMGGPFALSSLDYSQLRGDHYYYFNLNGLRALSQNPESFLRHFHFNVGYEVGQAFMGSHSPSPVQDGVLGIAGETPLGIILLGGSYGNEGEGKFFFRIGKGF
jgi:NTE family protein